MFKLTPDQQDASDSFMEFMGAPDEKYMVIQGAAGTGKSTVIKYILEAMQKQKQLYKLLTGNSPQSILDIEVTATTNKAVAVLTQLSDRPAITIHSLLRLTVIPNYTNGLTKLKKRKDYRVIRNTLIVVDEASFISNLLFKMLDESTMDCKVLLVGDQYQLAPVKQKESIMAQLDCRKIFMNKIMRNSGTILKTGAQFRDTVENSVFTPIIPKDRALIHVDGPTFQQMVDETFSDPEYQPDSAKILAWTNGKVIDYNSYIRKLRGYPEAFQIGEPVVTNKPIILGSKLWPTDMELCITKIAWRPVKREGVPGRVVEFSEGYMGFLPDSQEEAWALMKAHAKQKNWERYFEIKNSWLDLRPTYASTVHKSQGSTYHTVFVDLADIGRCTIASDVARMLYVSISRASHKVILYGELPQRYKGELI